MTIPTVQNAALLSEFYMYIKWVALLCTYLYIVLLCAFFTYVNNSSNTYMQRGFVKYMARYTRFVVLPVHSLVVTPTLVPASSYVCEVASVFMALYSMRLTRNAFMCLNAPTTTLVSVNTCISACMCISLVQMYCVLRSSQHAVPLCVSALTCL